jgi:tryptophanyl-tRNA synthetase
MLTGQLKAKCIDLIQRFVGEFQERRSKLTDDVVKQFMDKNRKITPSMNKVHT